MNEAAEACRWRTSLIERADTSAGWRYRKAREFPWDARNVESAKSLRRLHTALTDLRPDHDLWSRYAAICSRAAGEECLRLVEIEYAMLHSYGFSIHGAAGSAEGFLLELLPALELELAAPAHDGEEAEPGTGIVDAFQEGQPSQTQRLAG